jgi:hypothetical protein
VVVRVERLPLRKELLEVTPYFLQSHLLAAGSAQAEQPAVMVDQVAAAVAIPAQIGQAVPVTHPTLRPPKETMAAQVYLFQPPGLLGVVVVALLR